MIVTMTSWAPVYGLQARPAPPRQTMPPTIRANSVKGRWMTVGMWIIDPDDGAGDAADDRLTVGADVEESRLKGDADPDARR